MGRTWIVAGVVVMYLSLRVSAGESPAERRKAETLAKAETLLGLHYSPSFGRPLRLWDEQTETGPPDAVIYWLSASHVVELVFASDGSIARVQLLPEVLLHSDSWSDVPDGIELSRAEMPWLVDSASALQPLGKPGEIRDAPDGCSQSGQNLYCADTYEHAVVSHYHLERGDNEHVAKIALKEISISYRQSVIGIVEDVRVQASQRQVKVSGQWYHGEKLGIKMFENAQKGSVVRFITYGCTTNEKACIAVPEDSESTITEQ